MSATSQTCPQCGTQLKPGVPGGLCLSCLLSLGLKPGAADGGDAAEDSSLASSLEGQVDQFDRFRLLEKIGEGGCGVVYRAEQLQPVRREVALKVIKLGMDTGSVIARFEAERQALALMDHPGIAKVYDAGTSHKGRPFFAMELVSGERITDYCDRRQLPIPQRLELFARVCEAVQHAHQKGIIHRDLKPSNILVTEHDGMAQPKVIDFGIAKATSRQRLADQTVYTAFEQFVGTPAYMSPEQAGATGEDVDTRSDIYSLGVLLYELLTGRPPFEPERLRQAAVDEVFRIIRDEDPARPSVRLTTLSVPELSEISRRRLAVPPKLLREVRGDLDWVVMKALEKLPARRYETANALAVEVRRHLNHEPVRARPPSSAYRFQKMVRRNQLVFGATVAVILTLLVGALVSTWRFLREKEARERAVAAEAKAAAQADRSDQVARLLKEMLAGAGPSAALGRDTTMLREILDGTARRIVSQFTNSPEVQIELLDTIGRAYYDLKELDKAEAIHRETLRLREKSLGITNAAVADSLVELASVLNSRAGSMDLSESESLLRRAQAMRANPPNDEPLKVADVLEMLEWNLRAQNKTSELESLNRQVLAIRQRLLRADDPAIVRSLNALAGVLARDSSQLEEAEQYSRAALAIQDRSVNPDDPARIEALHALAGILTARDKLAEAEVVYREAIALRQKLHGDENELLSGLMVGLAWVLSKEAKFDEAERVIRDAINLLTRIRGAEHPNLATYHLGVLCEIYYRQQLWPESEAVAREWIPLVRKVIPDRPDTLMAALSWLSIALVAQGKWVEAEPILREQLALCERLHESPRPPGDTRCMGIRRMFGETLLRLNKPAEAEPLLLASYENLKGSSGKWELIDCEKSLDQLVQLCDVTSRPAEAAEWKQKLASFQRGQSAKSNAVTYP